MAFEIGGSACSLQEAVSHYLVGFNILCHHCIDALRYCQPHKPESAKTSKPSTKGIEKSEMR